MRSSKWAASMPTSRTTSACETSYPGFLMFRDDNDVLSGLFAFAPLPDLNVVHDGHAELATALLATGDMYDVLGVAPAHGRLLTAADDVPAAPIAVVLSHAYWQRRFSSDPLIVGQPLQLNTSTAIVVGVVASQVPWRHARWGS